MNKDGFTEQDVLPKIKSLRQTLNLEKKIQKSKMSGAGIEDLYIPQIP